MRQSIVDPHFSNVEPATWPKATIERATGAIERRPTAACGARYYHPEIPRFISPDPVGGKPEIPMSWNKYLYCRNDPVNAFDPDGRKLLFANGVSDTFKGQFKAAVDYLNKHGASYTITKLEARREIVIIQPGSCNEDEFDPNTRTITWNPTGSVVSSNGEVVSPATGLVHESGHALLEQENPDFAATLSNKEYKEGQSLYAYGTAEEYLIISTVEWPVAVKLGEDKRTTHSVTYVTVERTTDLATNKIESEVKSED